jgi:hypothetical protein
LNQGQGWTTVVAVVWRKKGLGPLLKVVFKPKLNTVPAAAVPDSPLVHKGSPNVLVVTLE